MLTASQKRAIRSLPEHETARVPTAEGSRPSSIYTSPAHFAAEQAGLFRRLAVPLTVSAMIAKPDTFFAIDTYGVPIIVTRDTAGKVHAFLNACRHRGSRIVEASEPVCAKKVSCPYHAWTYAADGRLIGIPRQDTFPTVRMDKLGLVRLACREAGGVIWVHLDHNSEGDFSQIDNGLTDDFTSFNLADMHVYGRRVYELSANWKLVLEPFLEAYHIQRLHAKSIAPMFADVPTIVHRLGLHFRQISGKINFDPSQPPSDMDELHKVITHAYLIFPNGVLITSPYYISFMIVSPRAAGKSIVDYYMLTKMAPDNPKAEELYARSFTLIDEVFGKEDFRAAELSQQGLDTGGIPTVYFGGLEETIPPFHDAVESFLGDATA